MSSIQPIFSPINFNQITANRNNNGRDIDNNRPTNSLPLMNDPYGAWSNSNNSMFMMLISMFQSMMSQFLNNGYNLPPYCQPPVEPPVYPPVEPPICPPPPQNKVLGSAGLFGDPQFGVFTPGLDVPDALRGFDSNIKAGQTVTLLKDTDLGGLKVKATGVQVDPNNANSIGIGSATFKSGNDIINISGSGALTINGQLRGNLNNAGLIAPIILSNGVTISTAMEIDGANGARAERFVIRNGEYKITAAPRKPHADSKAYLDMNFEELTVNAADNATGYNTNVSGINGGFGIPQLLRMEPGLSITA